MLARLQGTFQGFTNDGIIVDVNGLGFEAHVSPTTQQQMPKAGTAITLQTLLLFRQEMPMLFGFLTHEEKSLFQLLITVQGVGPKVALAILGVLPSSKLLWAIKSEDQKALTQVDGVGPKLARRLLTELKDKVEKISHISLSGNADFISPTNTPSENTTSQQDTSNPQPINDPLNPGPQLEEALLALEALGYEKSHCYSVLNELFTHSDELMETGAIIKAALRKLSPLVANHEVTQ